jgi:hypothetical protein
MPFRWIQFTRVSMQRAGVVLAVIEPATVSRSQTLEGISKSYSRLLTRRAPVPEEIGEAFGAYVRSQRLWERYGKGLGDRAPDQAELQDLWLADKRAPSSTGAITEVVKHEPPQLATAIRLLRPANFTVTDRGRALAAASEKELRSLHDGTLAPNPFVPSDGAKAILLFSLLDADIEFMSTLYQHILSSGAEFSRVSVSECLADVIAALIADWGRRIRSGEDRKAIARLKELHGLVSRPRGSGEKWGGGRPPDQTSTVRIEPYVDLRLIDKPSRHLYDYRLTLPQRVFFEQLASTPPTEFLERHLIGRFLHALGHPSPARVGDEDLWSSIRLAYHQLRSPLGYASLVEVVLLAIAGLLDEGAGFFEVGDGIDMIRTRHDDDPRGIRYGVTRGGGLTYVKIADRAGGQDAG